ncbi:hypothetical protein [Sphingomonas quercus]|uniref:Calcium-binding protein n=1 Tax=Sphingomonas quercus TaxID=2842451 RepID=A0ABS6BFD9_9SPHN|nr:hypothetical protein [Sphingomonas quercus]MBU3076541.1 hypothetical protein [Sphingomonas quercus]
MKTLLIAAAALAGPALAQAPMTAIPQSAAVPAGALPPLPDTPQGPVLPSPSAESQAQAAALPSGVIADAVRAQWGKYDRENKGALTPLEFGAWVMAANGRSADGMPPAQVLNATAGFFGKADANGDHVITPQELTSFLAQ